MSFGTQCGWLVHVLAGVDFSRAEVYMDANQVHVPKLLNTNGSWWYLATWLANDAGPGIYLEVDGERTCFDGRDPLEVKLALLSLRPKESP